jgi:alpha-mannosidase
VVSGLKRAADGDGLVLRLYEPHGRTGVATVAVPEGVDVWEATVVEDRVRRLSVRAGEVALRLRPWQVVTLRLGTR